MKSRDKRARDKALSSKAFMREAHQDLEESKQSVRELLKLRQAIYNGKEVDKKALEHQKEKALEALNNLFNDELSDRN